MMQAARQRQTMRWNGYVATVVLIGVLLGTKALLWSVLPGVQFWVADILVIGLIAYLYGRRPGLLALALCIVGYFYFYIPPSFTWLIAGTKVDDWVQWAVLIVGEVAAVLAMSNVRESRQGLVEKTDQLVLEAEVRKKAEAAFRQSEEQYRRIVETSQEGVWLIDADLRTTYVNQRVSDMLGYTRDEMLGRVPLDFLDDSYIEEARAGLERRKLGSPGGQAELRYRRKDGTELWAIISTNSLMDDNGRFIGALGMITDITDRKLAEDAVRESEERLRLTTEASNVGTWAWDMRTSALDWDARSHELLGLSPDSGTSLEVYLSAVHHDDRQRVMEAVHRAVDEREKYDIEYRVIHRDGAVRWLHSRGRAFYDKLGNPVRILGTGTDITDRKNAEEALRELEAHKRDFYRKTILAATGGKLDIVEPEDIRALRGELVRTWRFCTLGEYSLAVSQSFELAKSLGFKADSLNRFMSCAGEMLSNAQKHAHGGEASLYRTDSRILFTVSDTGHGIDSINLPDVAFVRGYTTAGTGGLGYKLIIGCADKTYLATGPDGTTVAVEIGMPG